MEYFLCVKQMIHYALNDLEIVITHRISSFDVDVHVSLVCNGRLSLSWQIIIKFIPRNLMCLFCKAILKKTKLSTQIQTELYDMIYDMKLIIIFLI